MILGGLLLRLRTNAGVLHITGLDVVVFCTGIENNERVHFTTAGTKRLTNNSHCVIGDLHHNSTPDSSYCIMIFMHHSQKTDITFRSHLRHLTPFPTCVTQRELIHTQSSNRVRDFPPPGCRTQQQTNGIWKTVGKGALVRLLGRPVARHTGSRCRDALRWFT